MKNLNKVTAFMQCKIIVIDGIIEKENNVSHLELNDHTAKGINNYEGK